jgi:DNA-binding NarL/FixJ family response regulator
MASPERFTGTVVIAEDSVLLRAGLARLLDDGGIEVVAQAGDGPGLIAAVDAHRPDLAIVDVRMPPTHTDEGLRAAPPSTRRSSPSCSAAAARPTRCGASPPASWRCSA